MSWSKGRFFLTRGARTLADSDFPQDHLQRAEVGEGRLQEVEPDKGGEPQPIGAVEVSQQKADQDEDARKSPEDHFHNIMYLLPLSCHGEKPKARLSIVPAVSMLA